MGHALWIVSYPLLERIHYLLVAGFDVFGNVGHQINTRLYMDFLRMEGETNLLSLLPLARRRPLIDAWYRGAGGEGSAPLHVTVMRDSAHTNVAQLFDEDARRVPGEDGLTVVPGLLGAYPNALFSVPGEQLEPFVDAVAALRDKPSCETLRAVRRVARERPLLAVQRPAPKREPPARIATGGPPRLQPPRSVLNSGLSPGRRRTTAGARG